MWSFSAADWLRKKSVAWLKWSKNFSERARTLAPSSRSGNVTKPPAAARACIGQPPPIELGS